jgi:hypothetical protein
VMEIKKERCQMIRDTSCSADAWELAGEYSS